MICWGSSMVQSSEAHQALFLGPVFWRTHTCSHRVSYSAHRTACLSIIYTTSSPVVKSFSPQQQSGVSVCLSWSRLGERDAEQLAVVIYKVDLQALGDEIWQVFKVLLVFCGQDQAGHASTLCLEEQTDTEWTWRRNTLTSDGRAVRESGY